MTKRVAWNSGRRLLTAMLVIAGLITFSAPTQADSPVNTGYFGAVAIEGLWAGGVAFNQVSAK